MPMHGPDSHYLDPYREAQQTHGSDFKVTLWANERSQRLRFRVMAEMVLLAGKRVLDAGCSRGDFAAYLAERDIPYETFIGVDGLPEVIDYAKGRDLPRSTFVAGDFVNDPSLLATGDPQIIAISGTLNTMEDGTAITLLDHAWRSASQALIFNFLSDANSSEAPKQKPPARRLPTKLLLDWALSHTSAVRFRQDYFALGHDATILMWKR